MKRSRSESSIGATECGTAREWSSFFHTEYYFVPKYRIIATQDDKDSDSTLEGFLLNLIKTYSIEKIIPEDLGDASICCVDTRKLRHPVQYGHDNYGQLFVCLTLRGDFDETGVLTLYCDAEDCWKYCFCKLNTFVSPLEYEDSGSRVGDLLINPNVSDQDKIDLIQGLLNKSNTISFTSK